MAELLAPPVLQVQTVLLVLLVPEEALQALQVHLVLMALLVQMARQDLQVRPVQMV